MNFMGRSLKPSLMVVTIPRQLEKQQTKKNEYKAPKANQQVNHWARECVTFITVCSWCKRSGGEVIREEQIMLQMSEKYAESLDRTQMVKSKNEALAGSSIESNKV